MSKNFKNVKHGSEVREFREITVTSKRQITIPKSFFDRLEIEETLVAYLTDDGIFLKPVRLEKNSIYDHDVKTIIRNVLNDDGLSEVEKVEEIAYRMSEYNKLIDRRIQEFDNDIVADSVLHEAEDDDYNGLHVFFDTETDQNAKEAGK